MRSRTGWKWLLVLFAIGLVVSVVFFGFRAEAQMDNYCKLLGGATTPVTGNASLNEGSFQFNFNSVLATVYRSCAQMQMVSDLNVGGDFLLDGWVWNSNLGWTALGAHGAAAPYKNSNVDVGNYYFDSYVKWTLNNGVWNGQLRGWWWNDALGWISLNCIDITNQCGTSNYGGTVAANGSVTGYAWSNSVGWINLTGMTIPVATQLEIVPEVSINLIPVTGSGTVLPVGSPVYADTNATAYKFGVDFTFEGQSLLSDYRFDFNFLFKDQTMSQQVADNGSSLEFNTPPTDRGNAPNPLVVGKETLAVGTSANYQLVLRNGKLMYLSNAVIKSSVPTLEFSTGDDLLSVAKLNNFRATKTSTGEQTTVSSPRDLNVAVPFAAPVVTSFVQGGVPNLNLVLGTNDAITATNQNLVQLSSASLQQRIVIREPGDSKNYYCFFGSTETVEKCVVKTDPDGNLVIPRLGYFRFAQTYSSVAKLLNLYVAYFGTGSQSALSNLPEGTGVYAYVVSGANNYITGTLLASKFQVFEAEVKGNTRVDASRSLLDNSSNLVGDSLRAEKTREDYLKYGQAVTRGLKPGTGYQAECDSSSSASRVDLGHCKVLDTTDRKAFVVQSRATNRANPVSLSASQFTGAKENVVVITGRDVVIDNDLLFESNGVLDKNKKLVLMVFKNGNGVGGHIYVRGAVTMLQANIYADGTMFSVPDGWVYTNDKIEPVRTADTRDNLKNQFVLLGSLVSQNTIGGCDLATPRLGDGQIVGDHSVGSKERACLYDLNYFRYSPMVFAEGNLVWPAGETYKLAWQVFKKAATATEAAVTDATAKADMRAAVVRPNPATYAIVNLEYSAPPQDPNLPKLPTGFTFSN